MDPIIAIDKDTHELKKVSDVGNGLKCNCICYDCRGLLEACQGDQRQYFRHHSNDRNCTGSWESQLHLLSKYIIEQNKSIALPEWSGQFLAFSARKQVFTDVQVEIAQDELKPDCLCTYVDEKGEEQKLWIEILNTHAVDPDKAQKIKERGVACVEIDVSGLFPDKEINEDVLKDFLLYRTENRKWINNPINKAQEKHYIDEANLLKKEDSIIKYIDSHSDNSENIEELQWVGFCFFAQGYLLSQKTQKFLYYYLSLYCNQSRIGERGTTEQSFFVSAAQFMMATLIQREKILVNKGTKIQGFSSVFNRTYFCEGLTKNCDLILRNGKNY